MDVSTAWNNTYTAISGNVSDPESRNKKWIYSAVPDLFAKNFNGFPLIVINPFEQRERIVTLKNDTKRKEFISEIDIYSKSAKVNDDITVLVINALDNVSDLYIDKVESMNHRQVKFGGKQLHIRNIIARWFVYD